MNKLWGIIKYIWLHYIDPCISFCSKNNLLFIAPAVFISSLIVSISFYMETNKWNFATSYYFSASVMLGDMYLVPSEESIESQNFTLCLFLWGTTLLTGAIGAFANELVSKAIAVAADERKKVFTMMEAEDFDGDGHVGYMDSLNFYYLKFIHIIGWDDHKSKYLTVFAAINWMLLGVLYAVHYEELDVGESFYFAIAAMSASGSHPPKCIGGPFDCVIDDNRALLVGTYIIIGCPLFAYTMGQFAGLVVEHAVRSNEIKLMMRPLTDDEFRFAIRLNHANEMKPFGNNPNNSDDNSKKNYHHGDIDFSRPRPSSLPSPNVRSRSQTIGASGEFNGDINLKLDFSDFIVLELLRLRKVEMSDLEHIKRLFDEIDDDGEGIIDKRKLRKHQLSRGLTSNHSSEKIDDIDLESNTNYNSISNYKSNDNNNYNNSDNVMFSSKKSHHRSRSSSPERNKSGEHVEYESYYESINHAVIDAAYHNIEMAINLSGSEDEKNNNCHSNDEYEFKDDENDIVDDEILFLNQMNESYNSSVIPIASHNSKEDYLSTLLNSLNPLHTDEIIVEKQENRNDRNDRNRAKYTHGRSRRRSNTVTYDVDNRSRMRSSTNLEPPKFIQPKRAISFTSPTKFPPREKDRLLAGFKTNNNVS